MLNIAIYKSEREAGLTEIIKTKSKLSYACELKTVDPASDLVVSSSYNGSSRPNKVKAATNGSFDLHAIQGILVSVGINKNEDVFDKTEVWNARNTPEDKMLNLEHSQADIIGHITSNCVVSTDYVRLADDLVIDELPDKFHIVTGAVIYREWEDKEQDERIKKIIAEITEGAWSLSMEALFKGFDYFIIHPDKTTSVIARNEQTAFLTKHLKAYGGSGEYKDYKLGRLMRNIVFSGKGLVRKPANPESIIFTDTEIFPAKAFATQSLGYDLTAKQEKVMAVAVETEKEREVKLEAKLQELLKAKEDGLNTRISELEIKVKASEDARLAAEKKLTEIEASLKTKSAELVEVNENYKEFTRTLSIMNKLDVSQEEAEEMYKDVFASMSDEGFEKHIAKMEDYFAKKKATYEKAPAEESPAGGVKKDAKKGDLEGERSEVAPKFETTPAKQPVKTAIKKITQPGMKASPVKPINASILDNAESDKEATLSIATDNKIEKVRASISSYLADNYLQMKITKEE